MEATEWKWNTKDDLEIFSKTWLPANQAKGIVCVVHGVGEHIGRYQVDGEILVEAGYAQAAFDQRGFGKSKGQLGHTPSLEAYFNDIEQFLGEVSRRYPNLPRFLYGMSMGAILVLAYTPIRQPAVNGVIAAAPGLRSSVEEQKFKVFLAKMLGKLTPTITIKSGIDPQTLCRDQQVIDAFVNDPLVHSYVTTGWGKAMLDAVKLAFENAPRFPLPLLLMHGTEDKIAYPAGSQRFAELAPKDKVTLKMWNGFKHELRTDPEKADVFRWMIEWMNNHLH